jgi:excisionase family DNA binding protein
MIMKVYMTIEEVARSLRVSVPTVRWLRQEGQFAPAIKIGRRLVWDEAEVLAWMERNRESARAVW